MTNINNGFITGTLQGLTGNNINSVVQDGDWVPYQNMSNVLSFESNELFGAASNDISATIDVTVTGCVEQIMFVEYNKPIWLINMILNNKCMQRQTFIAWSP